MLAGGSICCRYSVRLGVAIAFALSAIAAASAQDSNAEALAELQQAADRGNPDALYKLGMWYWEGVVVSQDVARYAACIEAAATQGLVKAQVEMGTIEFYGRGRQTNVVAAARWWETAADKGDVWAHALLGSIYQNGQLKPDARHSFQHFLSAAEKGMAMAQTEAGDCYAYGTGTAKDIGRAFIWYETAAGNGDARAYLRMGIRYEKGLGVPRNPALAFSNYLAAAEAGNSDAALLVGTAYVNGMVTPRDIAASILWCEKAGDLGNARGYLVAGMSYISGRGVAKNHDKALQLLDKYVSSNCANMGGEAMALLMISLLQAQKSDMAGASTTLARAVKNPVVGVLAAVLLGIVAVCFLVVCGVIFAALVLVPIPCSLVTKLLLSACAGAVFTCGTMLLMARARRWRAADALALSPLRGWKNYAWIAAGLLVAISFSWAYTAILHACGLELPEQAVAKLLSSGFGPGGAVVMILSAGVLLPACEEVIFRGVLYQACRNRWSVRVALVVSSLVFAVVHLELGWMLPVAVVGFVLAYAYEKTNNLAVPIGIHVLNNIVAVVIAMAGDTH